MKRSTASRGAFAILVVPAPHYSAQGNLAPLQGAGHYVTLNPGVSLRSTPGYGLASLRDGPGNETSHERIRASEKETINCPYLAQA